MLARFAFIFLICALVVPRAAWGAHLAGHEELTSSSSVHTHHADHAHEHEGKVDSGYQNDADNDSDSAGKGLTHDHSPSLSLLTALLLPSEMKLSTWFTPLGQRFSLNFGADERSHPGSLLRPPRAA